MDNELSVKDKSLPFDEAFRQATQERPYAYLKTSDGKNATGEHIG